MKKKLRDERKWWIDKMKVINRNILTKKQNEIILLRLDGKSFSEIGKITNRTSYRDWETDRKSTRLNSSH